MAASVTTMPDGRNWIIRLNGRFDHATMADFRKAYESASYFLLIAQLRPSTAAS